MERFGLLSYLMTGQVLPTYSPLHRLDPRTRLLGFVGLLIAFVFAPRVEAAALALAATALLVILARVPLRHAGRGLALLLPWLLLIVALQLLFRMGNGSDCRALLAWGLVRVTVCTARFALLTLVRFVGMVTLVGLLTWTSPIPDLARAIESLASPLDRLGLPGHELGLVGVIAMRFTPTLALETDRLIKAQAARGGDLKQRRGGLVQRVRQTFPLIVPIFVLALRRAERLAEAMEARAYSGGRGRGHYVRLHFRPADWLALLLVVLVAVIVLAA